MEFEVVHRGQMSWREPSGCPLEVCSKFIGSIGYPISVCETSNPVCIASTFFTTIDSVAIVYSGGTVRR